MYQVTLTRGEYYSLLVPATSLEQATEFTKTSTFLEYEVMHPTHVEREDDGNWTIANIEETEEDWKEYADFDYWEDVLGLKE